MSPHRLAGGVALAAAATLVSGVLRANLPLPPWVVEGDVPPPAWARSVVPRPGAGGGPGDLFLFARPSRAGERRGVTATGASLPFYGQKRGPGCSGSWWLVGPLAWTCSDDAVLSASTPIVPLRSVGADALPSPYAFVRSSGASAYADIESAAEGTPERDLEGGWAVAIVEQRTSARESWARTSKGLWIAQRDLVPARPSLFRGEIIGENGLDVAWVLADRANVWSAPVARDKPSKDKPTAFRNRFQLVRVREDTGPMVRLEDDTWMLARDLSRPSLAPPPVEVTAARERWIDVDVASQTLVAYEGARPVYATLVSTGREAAGSATRRGVHRIWVKLLSSDMDNVERGDLDAHYSIEDVPYVQYFDDATALHGAYWHQDFGHARSHGCINLAPLDASWLFAFTGPKLPPGWVAAYPSLPGEGTVVRVR